MALSYYQLYHEEFWNIRELTNFVLIS